MSSAFKSNYDELIATHQIKYEAEQDGVVAALDRLINDLSRAKGGRATRGAAGQGSIRGVYIWGHVGRGKSMLMNLFFEHADCRKKRRLHFHAFMQEVHAAMQPSVGQTSLDPVARAAEVLAQDAHLLCLDELEIIDIADAMIVGRLFDELFARGVTLVATSNDHPDRLYHDGPNRDAFLPFVEHLKEHVDVVELGGSNDFRLSAQADTESHYLAPVSVETRTRFEELWQRAVSGKKEEAAAIAVHGRNVEFSRTCGKKLRVTFSEVCRQPLSADDHLAIANRFASIFLEDVPLIPEDGVDECRRLVTLVDALYEAKVQLVVLAAAAPARIFARVISEDQRRTISRLNEMKGGRWTAQAA